MNDSGTEYIAESLIICTGAQAKWLGLETEKKFIGLEFQRVQPVMGSLKIRL